VLRTLEEQSFTPVGGDEMVTVDARVIASTNKDLKKKSLLETFVKICFIAST
jgi:transcriptional regulator with GAF, ATPase, and Fis domain